MLARCSRKPETNMDEYIHMDFTTVGLFLDMVDQAPTTYGIRLYS